MGSLYYDITHTYTSSIYHWLKRAFRFYFFTIGKKHPYVFSILLAVGFSLLIQYINKKDIDPNVLSIIIGFFVIVSISIFIVYLIDLMQFLKGTLILKGLPQDILVHTMGKEITFDDKSFESLSDDIINDYSDVKVEDVCIELSQGKMQKWNEGKKYLSNIKIFRNVRNNMARPYNYYRYEIESPSHVPSFSEIDIKINGESQKNRPYELYNPKIVCNFETDIKEEGNQSESYYNMKLSKVSKIFKIPITIPPKTTKSMSVEYPTAAYRFALLEEEDYVSMSVTQPTERLYFKITLTERMKSSYTLCKVSKHDDIKGGFKEFQVFDTSMQRMAVNEQKLVDENMIPIFKTNKIYWEILYPQIGHKYRLYFTMKKLI